MVAIDIISGFLGAGKTTFANLLLSNYIQSGERPVYIVNEFGRIGIDAKIIENKGFESVEMPNGCVCCTLKNDVAFTIKEVIRKFSPTRIIFEPSGIFIFDNFIEIIKSDALSKICTIGNIITIVDCVNYNQSKILAGSFIYNQIKNSPLLILSKIEKTKNNLYEIICDLKNINPTSVVFADKWSELTGEHLTSLLKSVNERKFNSDKTVHHEKLQSITISLNQNFDKASLFTFFKRIKANIFGNVYRIKGVIEISGKPYLLNVVFNKIDLKSYPFSQVKTLTFIGKKINKTEVEKLSRE